MTHKSSMGSIQQDHTRCRALVLPKDGRSHYGKPALERPVIGTKPPRGWLKWRRLCGFGKHVSPCEHVRRGRRAGGRECCSRNARSESRWRHREARLRCKPHGAARVRVMSPGIARHKGHVNSAQCSTWWMARKRALGAINRATLRFKLSAKRKGRANCKPPPCARVPDPQPGCSEHPRRGQRSIS